jgi:hypothetical protein
MSFGIAISIVFSYCWCDSIAPAGTAGSKPTQDGLEPAVLGG